ncbi:MAG: MobC family plasmid mobilization relaxosome protein [Veillonella sp.]|uniref:MobC family plasmid mobilization relaxosome protein n=1 Tax=Veillonella sp. TaxID=1926307 RepID=UPI00290490FF|nr:MobC family plasmid mobilization relaxosome protein [Veillonella sp.]MDU2702385.1 MobC family plasmid mobilization relaxosome protein [Veillonella sp.]
MANRKRNIAKQFYVNEEEDKLIKEKMNKLRFNNFGSYARKMIIDGYIIKTDYTVYKELVREINKIGVNINQIAKRINETNRVYDDDIKDLIKEHDELWQLLELKVLNQN